MKQNKLRDVSKLYICRFKTNKFIKIINTHDPGSEQKFHGKGIDDVNPF